MSLSRWQVFTVATICANWRSVQIGSRRDALRWGCTVPLLFSAMLVSSMFAMEHNTLGTVVVFRNVAPLFTLLIERLFRVPMQVSRDTILSLLTVVLGVVLYHRQALTRTRTLAPTLTLTLTPSLNLTLTSTIARRSSSRASASSPSCATWCLPCSSGCCSAT